MLTDPPKVLLGETLEKREVLFTFIPRIPAPADRKESFMFWFVLLFIFSGECESFRKKL
jgi:hypothetical protein